MTVVTYLFALIMALASQNVFAQKTFDFDDCIINGMKGVGSDAAAKLVKEACERKQRDQPDAKVDVYKKQLGRVMSEDTIELVEPPNSLDANFRAISIRNADADLTITFIRLKVTPSPVGGHDCDYLRSSFQTFRVTVPPQGQVKLLYPGLPGEGSCVSVATVFAKDTSPSDIPSRQPVKAMRRDPLMRHEPP